MDSINSTIICNDNIHLLYDVSRNGSIYRFFDGPPFCTGTPHYGHILVGVTKDAFLKFNNAMGSSCTNKVGYDCHGVPIEGIANRELNINSLEDFEKIGMEKFNGYCKQKIKDFERSWEPVYQRMGRWANFDSVYKTIDKNYMESVWWGFSELYKKKLIYRSYKVTAYSYALQSPLSNFEASQNYKEIDTRSIYVRFKLQNLENTYIVAWTTTPWTLPANIALCVNAELEYEFVKTPDDTIYIVGKGKHANCGFKNSVIIKTVPGSELVGMKYEPIYDSFKSEKYHRIVSDSYVKDSGSTGTDIVHIAPVFGEDDYRVCKENNIITDEDIADLEPVDSNCNFNSKVPKYCGRNVFDVETDIIIELKEKRVHLKTQQIKHEYPFCYRTETPLVYKVCKSFYVDVQKIKSRMIELNGQTSWYPSMIGSGRFNKWLEGAKDWCLSRSRYFGNPIPVWINIQDSNDMIVIGSVEELEQYTQSKIDDLHPEFMNQIEIRKTVDGHTKIYRRVPDIFDCWFESGSMTFAQYHYPFENQHIFDQQESLCDFICEGMDQTRGWFYTLFVISVALFDKKPAQNIMSMGLVLDSEKKKLSKKNQNYTDPNVLIDKFGADAVRLYLLQSPATYSESLAFKEDDIQIIVKDLYQFKNSIDFLLEHVKNQNLHNIEFDINSYKSTSNPMDLWIMQHINNTGINVTMHMKAYEVAKATRKVLDLIEDITNWYVKFNRERMKGKAGNDEWMMSTSVFAHSLKLYLIMLNPFAPFISQQMYTKLKMLNLIESEYQYIQQEPFEFKSNDDMTIIDTFNLLKKISKLVRTARTQTKTHTSSKTPIKHCEICIDSYLKLKQIESCIDLIQSELNIIDIHYSKLLNITYRFVPNKALLGKKYKKTAGDIYKFFEKSNLAEHINFDGILCFNVNNVELNINPDEYSREPVFDSNEIFEDDVLIKIDFTYDDLIEKMQHVKRFVSQIQQTRKQMGLHPWDAISIEISRDDFNIVEANVEYIKKRLECEINCNSKMESRITYEDEDSGRKIEFNVRML